MPAIDELEARRNADGGFGPVLGAASEAEPTAMAALVRGDHIAVTWLEDAQGPDGSIGVQAGPVFRDVTPLACLAIRSPDAVARALAWVRGSLARSEESSQALPHTPGLRGWAWTSNTFGWVEPTAWAVLCLRAAGDDDGSLADGIAMLADRECVGGGWNYGNRIVLDEPLPPFVQTSALALIALRGLEEPMVTRSLAWLRRRWSQEAQGLLSAATAAVAFRVFELVEASEASHRVARLLDTGPDPDTVSLVWARLALGDDLAALEVAP